MLINSLDAGTPVPTSRHAGIQGRKKLQSVSRQGPYDRHVFPSITPRASHGRLKPVPGNVTSPIPGRGSGGALLIAHIFHMPPSRLASGRPLGTCSSLPFPDERSLLFPQALSGERLSGDPLRRRGMTRHEDVSYLDRERVRHARLEQQSVTARIGGFPLDRCPALAGQNDDGSVSCPSVLPQLSREIQP